MASRLLEAARRSGVLLEADLGEGFGRWTLGDDDGLLGVVGGANVACGFHAGDPVTMRRVCRQAVDRGVVIGGHVGYRDLHGFGRRQLQVPRAELVADVVYQLGALAAIAATVDGSVRYVKAHGALYNTAAVDRAVADAVAEAVGAVDPQLPVVCPRGSEAHQAAVERGLPVIAEVFADRAYSADGTLVARSVAGSVVHDPVAAAARAVRMVTDGTVETIDGDVLDLGAVQAVCVHGDSPDAVAIVTAVREALEGQGIDVRQLPR